MVDTKLKDLDSREKVLLAISKSKKHKEKERSKSSTNKEDLDGVFLNTLAVNFYLCFL